MATNGDLPNTGSDSLSPGDLDNHVPGIGNQRDHDDLREISSNSSNASDRYRSVSSSERDFVKFGPDDLAEIPTDLLSDYGTHLVSNVIHEITQQPGADVPPRLSTPNNDEELASPLSNYTMDERDLYVPADAAAAEAHPIGSTENTQYHEHHNLQQVPETLLDYKTDEFDSLAGRQSPPEEVTHNPENTSTTQAKAAPTTRDLVDLDYEPYVQPTHPLNSGNSGDVERNLFEVAHEPNVDELDLLSKTGAKQEKAQSPGDFLPESETLETIPESSSPKGMRDFTADEEESTYNRQGPLTIPPSAYGTGSKQPHEQSVDGSPLPEEDVPAAQLEHAHSWPRPPTPPKVLDESLDKPVVMDLGPPAHPHTGFRRFSEKGLHSILKLSSSHQFSWKACWQGLDPRGKYWN
jgi:hypothetical protein